MTKWEKKCLKHEPGPRGKGGMRVGKSPREKVRDPSNRRSGGIGRGGVKKNATNIRKQKKQRVWGLLAYLIQRKGGSCKKSFSSQVVWGGKTK